MTDRAPANLEEVSAAVEAWHHPLEHDHSTDDVIRTVMDAAPALIAELSAAREEIARLRGGRQGNRPMNEPTRYAHALTFGGGKMEESVGGEYVRYDDYARLRSAFDELLGEVKSLAEEVALNWHERAGHRPVVRCGDRERREGESVDGR